MIHLQSSCIRDRDEPKPKELPPITTEGRNTIGFLLNGEVWLPGGGGIGHPNKDFVIDTTHEGQFHFALGTHLYKDNQLQSLFFRVVLPEGETKSGEAELDTTINYIVYFIDYHQAECPDFKAINNHRFEISFVDTDKNIISGTFEMEVENDCGEVYRITEGRFDGRFRYF